MEQKNIQLQEIKRYIQRLIDKYLPEESFDIQDFDEELIYILVDLLLEKNEIKKVNTYNRLYQKSLQLDEKIKQDYEKITKISNKIILGKIHKKEEEELKIFEKSFDDTLANI